MNPYMQNNLGWGMLPPRRSGAWGMGPQGYGNYPPQPVSSQDPAAAPGSQNTATAVSNAQTPALDATLDPAREMAANQAGLRFMRGTWGAQGAQPQPTGTPAAASPYVPPAGGLFNANGTVNVPGMASTNAALLASRGAQPQPTDSQNTVTGAPAPPVATNSNSAVAANSAPMNNGMTRWQAWGMGPQGGGYGGFRGMNSRFGGYGSMNPITSHLAKRRGVMPQQRVSQFSNQAQASQWQPPQQMTQQQAYQ